MLWTTNDRTTKNDFSITLIQIQFTLSSKREGDVQMTTRSEPQELTIDTGRLT